METKPIVLSAACEKGRGSSSRIYKKRSQKAVPYSRTYPHTRLFVGLDGSNYSRSSDKIILTVRYFDANCESSHNAETRFESVQHESLVKSRSHLTNPTWIRRTAFRGSHFARARFGTHVASQCEIYHARCESHTSLLWLG